jgi:hypothetical protein
MRPPYALCKVRVAFYIPAAPITDWEDSLSGRMDRGEERDAVRTSQGRHSSTSVAH